MGFFSDKEADDIAEALIKHFGFKSNDREAIVKAVINANSAQSVEKAEEMAYQSILQIQGEYHETGNN